MKNALFVLLATAAAASAAGIDSTHFSPPNGGYSIEYPLAWHKSFGMHTLGLRPPGQDGKELRFRLEDHDGDAKAARRRVRREGVDQLAGDVAHLPVGLARKEVQGAPQLERDPGEEERGEDHRAAFRLDFR